MKGTTLLTFLAFLFAFVSAGNDHDADDFCIATCQTIKGGSMKISSPTCPGVTGEYCEDYCNCSGEGVMTCSNKGVKCSQDAVTKTCEQGLAKQWECWCQDMSYFSDGWGPGKGETCAAN
ncbi:uncharacterized protein PV07_06653 [Cladophialophora immunda]|uniref:Uncharacterized protein n=1 Tax=Cladophialophora immunda TaxID=569365 RepID=A0A0D1ZG63_9EURO|nr:uncharacterized protein PV07_06653 [Cladophialophora immunda]KIW26851.1 hypothetical protein PV07_06653 [Cladophialophora immunda]OQV08227.1 hypothetical protein CLAIMM_12536 [Cladophialophora immunda]